MNEQFRALKPILIGENEFWIGDIFTIPDNRNWQEIVKLGLAELVEEKEGGEIPPSTAKNDLTNTSDNAIMPEIVKAGPAWKRVMLNGEQIGKSVKTDEEAQAIIDEWLENQTKPQ